MVRRALLARTRRLNNRPEPSVEQKLAAELVARAREQGVSLTGLLKILISIFPLLSSCLVRAAAPFRG